MNTKKPCGVMPTAEDLLGYYEHEFVTSSGLSITCFLEYDEGERATFSEPGHAAQINLVYALVEGVDISEVIGADTVLTIEEEAMADLVAKAAEYKAETLIQEYEDRRAAA